MAMRRLGLLFGLFAFASTRCGFLCFLADGTTLVEAIHAACGVYDALFACVKGVALRAQINANCWQCGMRVYFRPARRTRYRRLNVIWMDSVFHFLLPVE